MLYLKLDRKSACTFLISDRGFSLSVFLILFMLNYTGVFLKGETSNIQIDLFNELEGNLL